jgi:tryptophanyl-tRNA synthetase
MVTDPARVKRTDAGNPDLSPVYQLHKIFSSKEEIEEVAKGCVIAGIGCIDCKKILVKNIFKVMEPIWEKHNELLNKPDLLFDIVKEGNEKARKTAEETMQLVRKAMGLL